MKIGNFAEPVNFIELSEIENKTLEEIISIIKEKEIERLYITENLKPVFVFTPEVLIDIFFTNKLKMNVKDFISQSKKPKIITNDKHIIDTYNYLRKNRLHFAPVVDENGNLIGEIDFSKLSLKISFIAIKDPLTDTFNEKYFNVLIEEYNEIEMQVGIIMLRVQNIDIYEGLYGSDVSKKILKEVASIIKSSVRDVDFVFRNDAIFKILTFNNCEITMKIKHRLENKMKDLEIENLKVPCKVVATHIPELENNIIMAVERLEGKLFS